ncbi:unnamed protein product [Polarella glacialis]|uniref:Uncharacterized protein n=1 Tax=Polarella glacialis TaxID=89957 RepID=A0A813EJV2_POLGL|nr:unnamed protein product [Polarella glacialis]CAE8616347.1 unnamed protein product [Polarella glacialis]
MGEIIGGKYELTATGRASGWNINWGEKSKLGRDRPIALIADKANAGIDFKVNLSGFIGVRYLQSYDKFGTLKLSWTCDAGNNNKNKHLTGSVVLDGWHEDHTSLCKIERVVTASGLCTVSLLNNPGQRTRFKIEYLLV